MWTRDPINGGFRWVVLIYGCSCQNWCDGIIQSTVTILNMVLNCFIILRYLFYFWKQGYTAFTPKTMVGWDDDAFHSQVRCPSEGSESILCSYLPGGMSKSRKWRAVFWAIIIILLCCVVWDGVFIKISYLNI